MVRAAVAVLLGGAAEFREGHEADFIHAVREVREKGPQAIAEIAQAVGELTFGRSLAHMGIPPPAIRHGDADAEIRADQLRDLFHAFAQGAIGVDGAVRGLNGPWIFCLEIVECLKRFASHPAQGSIQRRAIHGFETTRDGTIWQTKIIQAPHGQGGDGPLKNSWKGGLERHSVKGATGPIERAQGAIQAAILRALDARRAALQKILGVEMGAGGVGRSSAHHGGEHLRIKKGFETSERWMQTEGPIQAESFRSWNGEVRA